VLERWSLDPGKTPTGLAFDRKNHRLFVGCRSRHEVVVNSDTGKVVATLPIGDGVDACAFDPDTGLVFASCRDGTVSVIHQEGPDDYKVVETIKTRQGSKTMGLDLKTHHLFLPAAELRGRTPAPGTFVVLVFGK